MFLSDKTSGVRTAKNPLPPKIAALLRESWWLALLALALYLLLVLYTYHKTDPGWSHSVDATVIRNAGGMVGAYIADLMLAVFGLSAYWWVTFCGALVWLGFRRIESVPETDRRSYAVAVTGFVIVLISSSGVEALRLYSLKAALPFSPGGMLGGGVSELLSKSVGFTGGTLILLMAFAAGLSLFTGVSWLTVIERLGTWLETGYLYGMQKRKEREDRRVGEQAVIEREEVVEVGRKKFEIHEPIRIEPAAVEIPKSPRVEREKQVPLFENLPDSLLPPLHLLDEPEKNVEVLSSETLEFTSRLIEKKLLDFGVEVKVVAAYPGPVVTRYEIEPAVGVKGSQIINLVRDLARALSVISIRVVETIPGKSCMGLEIPNPIAPDREAFRDSEFAGLCQHGLAADDGAGQGHRRQSGRRRSGAHAAPAGRRHHRFRQVGRDQCHDPVSGLQVAAVAGAG